MCFLTDGMYIIYFVGLVDIYKLFYIFSKLEHRSLRLVIWVCVQRLLLLCRPKKQNICKMYGVLSIRLDTRGDSYIHSGTLPTHHVCVFLLRSHVCIFQNNASILQYIRTVQLGFRKCHSIKSPYNWVLCQNKLSVSRHMEFLEFCA